jgi:NAD(P)H-dependent flavin oxidoreductase YrpB (nitropropane dioxygenase family)
MQERIIGISPFGRPDARLVVALCRAGALGVLDLGNNSAKAQQALDEVERHCVGDFGILLGDKNDAYRFPKQVRIALFKSADDIQLHELSNCRRLVQVSSVQQARQAVALGADGLIAKGTEAAGRVGSVSSYMLLQALLREFQLPIWVQGGIGLHTAPAAIMAGAQGVVLDDQLALLRETATPQTLKQLLFRALPGFEWVPTICSGWGQS